MTAPRVSICIPVRNNDAFVGAAIESALGQRHGNVQVLVSDNASTDSSWERIVAYAACQSYCQPAVLPMAMHWNWFRGRADGDWVLFLCADDVLRPDALDTCLALAASSAAPPDAVFFEYDLLYGDEVRSKVPFYAAPALIPARAQHRIFIIGNNYPLTMCLLRREALDAVGWFDESYGFTVDWDLWLKITGWRENGFVGYLPQKLGLYRQHAGNETALHVRNRSALDEVIRMKEHFRVRFDPANAELLDQSNRSVGRIALGYAKAMAEAGDAPTAAYYREHYRDYIALAGQPLPANFGMPASPPYPLPAGAIVVPELAGAEGVGI